MTAVCYGACGVAVISALLVILQRNAMHALLYLVVMLLALGLVFFTLGAPLLAVLEVAIYAGAIIVLFVFVVMMVRPAPPDRGVKPLWQTAGSWVLPMLLTLVLLGLAVHALASAKGVGLPAGAVGPKEVGVSLYTDYLVAVELASLLILAGLVGAFHLAPPTRHRVGEGVGPASPPPGERDARPSPPPGAEDEAR
jgi:NADH-quinone oxidoreductase subunit J